MNKDEIKRLLQRYITARKAEKDPYFDADEIDELLNSFEENEDFIYYEEILSLGLKLHPYSSELQIKKCKQFVYTGEYEQALILLNNISNADNQDVSLITMECYCSLDMYDKAVEHLESLIFEQCDYLAVVFEYIAPLLNDLDMNKEARDFIDRGLILFPDNQILKDELCYLLEMEGNIPEAIQVCNELIDKNPYSHEHWFTLGRLYSITAEYEKAVEAFDFALTCDSSNDELKILKAYCLYMNESYQKAIEVYNEFASEKEAWERIQPLVAECYMKLEEYEKAYQILEEYIYNKNIKTHDPTIYINFLSCCIETDRENEASNVLSKAMDLFPDNIRILSILALTYLEKGEEEKAKDVVSQLFDALDSSTDYSEEDALSIFNTGLLLLEISEPEKALSHFLKARALDPNLPQLNTYLAISYLAQNDKKTFEIYYNQLSQEESDSFIEKASKIIGDSIEVNSLPQDTTLSLPKELSNDFFRNKENNN